MRCGFSAGLSQNALRAESRRVLGVRVVREVEECESKVGVRVGCGYQLRLFLLGEEENEVKICEEEKMKEVRRRIYTPARTRQVNKCKSSSKGKRTWMTSFKKVLPQRKLYKTSETRR